MDIKDRFFSVFKTASRGLAVQRRNIQIAAENIANAESSRGADGINPYKPKMVRSTAPQGQDFMRTLEETSLQLKSSSPKHRISSTERNKDSISDLGPRHEIIELEKYRFEYDPTHPDADEQGMVAYPDVDMVEEMTRMVSANRLYEANLSVIEAEKEIIKRSLEI